MNAEQQRIAIAKHLKWRGISEQLLTGLAPWRREYTTEEVLTDGFLPIEPLPNWPEDLNACAELEATLDAEQATTYAKTLETIHESASLQWGIDHNDLYYEAFSLITATAAQRAEAFLRTLNLWQDDAPKPIGMMTYP